MCIMEVRPGQRSSTIAQAMAHNVSTVERDLDMFEPLIRARGETDLLAQIQQAHEHLKRAYEGFLSVFVHEVTEEVHVHGDHDHGDHEHGSERLDKQWEAETGLAAHWHGDDTPEAQALATDASDAALERQIRSIARGVAERDAHAVRRFETR
jgi:hypothetical protein